MADTDIRCHRACVYSSCSVRLCVIIRVRRSCDTDYRPPLMPAWDSVTAWERGERHSVSGAKAVSSESNLSQGPYWRSHTELYGELWTLTHARGRTATLCLHVRVHGLRPTGRRTEGADAAVRRRRTLHMLNYMLHCYLPLLPMGTIALPRQRSAMHRGVVRILHWLLQKLSAKAFFRKKVDDLFSRRLQNFTVLNKAGPTSHQSQFFRKKIHSIDGWGTWLRPWQHNATRCVRCHTAMQCVWMLPQCQPC